MARLMSSDASTSPPGELTFRMTALTRRSRAATLNWSWMSSTIVEPPRSNSDVMIPSTSTTAILLVESLSSMRLSSRRGMPARVGNEEWDPMPPPKRCLMVLYMLTSKRQRSTSAMAGQAPLRRFGGGAATRTGAITGGGVGGIGGGVVFSSILRHAKPIDPVGQVALRAALLRFEEPGPLHHVTELGFR